MFRCRMFSVLLFSILAFVTVSCESEQVNQLNTGIEETNLDFSNFSLGGINLGMNDKDGYFISSVDLNEHDIVDILDELSTGLFSEDLEENEYLEVITIYNAEENTFSIKSKRGDLSETIEEKNIYSDSKCGEGEGWEHFENCLTESCVRREMEKTIDHFKDDLKIGNCIDTRLRRTHTGVIVCGRYVKC